MAWGNRNRSQCVAERCGEPLAYPSVASLQCAGGAVRVPQRVGGVGSGQQACSNTAPDSPRVLYTTIRHAKHIIYYFRFEMFMLLFISFFCWRGVMAHGYMPSVPFNAARQDSAHARLRHWRSAFIYARRRRTALFHVRRRVAAGLCGEQRGCPPVVGRGEEREA